MESGLEKIAAQIGMRLGGVGIVALLAALGLGRLLPKGELYVYTLPWRSEPAVYLLDIERAVSVPLTKSLPRAEAYRLAALSPDGNQIGVTVAKQGNGDLYLLDIRSGRLSLLLTQDGYNEQAAWSPDGRWITYSSLLQSEWDIYKVEVATGVTTRLTNFTYSADQPSWSPDGQRIAFVSGLTLFVMAADCPELEGRCGRAARQITYSGGIDSLPVWSPDGTQIAFVSTRSGRAEMYVMDVGCLNNSDGCLQQNPRQLTHGLGRLQTLSWSAERELLGFITDQYGRAGLYSVQMECAVRAVLGQCNVVPLVIVEP